MAELADWQWRVVQEENELRIRLNHLGDFLDNLERTEALDAYDLCLLKYQQSTMEAYQRILLMRIDRFPK